MGRTSLSLLAGLLALPAVAVHAAGTPTERPSDSELVAELRAVFAAGAVPPGARADAAPRKCATLLLQEYDARKAHLPAVAVAEIEDWLASGTASTAVLESAHFRFSYATSGADAVPLEDTAPSDGVPDFVQVAALRAETAWTRLVDETGFHAPLLHDGKVDVSFRAMAAYGYTRPVDGIPAMTLHHTFDAFPANDDPEGSVAGAMKVTLAHELKHATQFASSGWTEGGWLEADAVWAEDWVFDATDDYIRYLASGSPISSPADWQPVSYEECVVPRLLSERWGAGILVDFFARREAFPAEAVLASYDAVLRARGSNWPDALSTLALWSWFCGANAEGRPVGFTEAARYPTPPVAAHLDRSRRAALAGMGTDYVLATGPDRSGTPHAAFVGDAQAPFSAWVVTLERSGRRAVHPLPAAAANAGAVDLVPSWEQLATVTFVVTNLAASGVATYGVALDDEDAVGVGETAAAQGLLLQPARPNPFRDAATLSFSLPEPATVHLDVYDAAGRLVRRVVDGDALPAGRHERVWDGRDATGHAAAPGFYAVRLEAAGKASTRKLLLVR